MESINRRQFLETTLGIGAAAALGTGVRLASAQPASSPVAFFLIGDTHYLAEKEKPADLDEESREVTGRLIERLNTLPGTEIPVEAGGGKVAAIGAGDAGMRGVIHAGDVIDSGDKQGPGLKDMQQTEFAAFAADFGVTGKEGKLKLPVYEVHGNHDSPAGDGLAVGAIKERNKKRAGLANLSDNGLHYAWDWGHVHFVNLGIVVGGDKTVERKRRYNPLDSLAFLIDDLKKNVGDSGKPVVLTHHIDVSRYSQACDAQTPPKGSPEWDPCDVRAYYDALKPYRVAAILFGHTHVRKVARWDGTPKEPKDGGLTFFNTDNVSHFASETQGLMYFEIGAKELVAREVVTKDRWQNLAWTPQVWRVALG